MRALGAVSIGFLLLGTACRWGGPVAREKVYAGREAGLTLIYENPQLETQARLNERLQVRVAATKETPAGTAVRMTYTSLRGELSSLFYLKNGGVFLSRGDQTPNMTVIPEGFPDRVTTWDMQGTTYRVLGRATADLHGLSLPDTADRVGVWMESQTPQGLRQRTFLLPDIGEVETLVWRNEAWVSINRLVSRGFTDAPSPRK